MRWKKRPMSRSGPRFLLETAVHMISLYDFSIAGVGGFRTFKYSIALLDMFRYLNASN